MLLGAPTEHLDLSCGRLCFHEHRRTIYKRQSEQPPRLLLQPTLQSEFSGEEIRFANLALLLNRIGIVGHVQHVVGRSRSQE